MKTSKPKRIHKDPRLAAFIPAFLQNRREDAAAMREALERQDFESIGFIAHRMRGSGGMFGFPEITDLGGTLEVAAEAANTPDLQRGIEELGTYIERVAKK